MIINELKLPFPIYTRRLRQNRFRENCAGMLNHRLITPNNALLPFQFRVDGGDVIPDVVSWKLNRVCPQFVTTVVNGEYSTEFEDDEFPVFVGSTMTEIPSTLVITYDTLKDELGADMVDELGVPILTGEVDITGETYNLTGLIGDHIRKYTHNGGFNYAYNGTVFPFALECGYYEMFIKLSNGLSYWSEVFQIVEFPAGSMPYLKIGWGNAQDLEKIVFRDGFEGRIFLNSFIAHSEPQITEEVEPDGLGVEQVVSVVSTDRYLVSEVLPDYLKTALAAAPVCRNIYIEDPKTMVEFQATRMRTTSQVEADGCNSFIEMQFEVDNEVFRTACQ
jgi:hypothetical protein